MVVLYVIDNIIIHMNPESDSGGDGERESCDTEDRSDWLFFKWRHGLVAGTVTVM